MAKHNVGTKNGMWKGGRTVTRDGYVLIRVGKDHHLADVRGYAYEHRLVAEKKLGRRLAPGELVHHKNENRSDNRPSNLIVEKSIAHHLVHHRKRMRSVPLRMPDQANEEIECECGCGSRFRRFDRTGRARRFVSGHNGRTRG